MLGNTVFRNAKKAWDDSAPIKTWSGQKWYEMSPSNASLRQLQLNNSWKEVALPPLFLSIALSACSRIAYQRYEESFLPMF